MTTALRAAARLRDAPQTTDLPSDAVERLVRDRVGGEDARSRSVDIAAERARSLATGGELYPAMFLAELLPELCLDRDFDDERIRLLVHEVAELADTPRSVFQVQLAQFTVAGRALAGLAPLSAIQALLRLVPALAPARQVSLWESDEAGQPVSCAHAGPFPSKRTGELAQLALRGALANHSTGFLIAVPVVRWETTAAVLMARPRPGGQARCAALLRQLAPAFGTQLERRSVIERAAATERVLTEASERRLSRLAFDLHDGPLQNVAGIAGDLAMLRRRLRQALPDEHVTRDVLGCVDDLEARLRATDTELRDLSHSLESPTAPRLPLPRMFHAELQTFNRITDIRADLEVDGDFDDLTDSQRIALWRIFQESLSNAREHSCARQVQVKAVATKDRLQLEVADDGRGFEVRETLFEAARRGRLGLVGVSERVRLLGGRCDISSSPGGPTTIAVTLPRWRPPNLAPT